MLIIELRVEEGSLRIPVPRKRVERSSPWFVRSSACCVPVGGFTGRIGLRYATSTLSADLEVTLRDAGYVRFLQDCLAGRVGCTSPQDRCRRLGGTHPDP